MLKASCARATLNLMGTHRKICTKKHHSPLHSHQHLCTLDSRHSAVTEKKQSHDGINREALKSWDPNLSVCLEVP